MNFNSLQYLLFLPASVVLYYALKPRLRNPALLVLSYYFYACWEPVYALLMLFSTATTYLCGLLMGKISPQAGETAKRERELSQLKKQLADAIAGQQYEECAKLRDRIQELEGNGDEQQ